MNQLRKINFGDILIYTILSVTCIIMLFPLWQTIMSSLMSETEYYETSLRLIVKNPTLVAYKTILNDGRIFINLRVTIFITLFGTLLSLFITALTAYGLSKEFFGATLITYLIVGTMFLKVGLIPEYITLKKLDLIDNMLVYFIYPMILPFYLVVMKTNFKEFSKEVLESASIDGAGLWRTFFSFVLPLSKPILAAIGLFYGVRFWNMYLESVFFITDPAKKTVQEYLNKIVSDSTDIQNLMMSAETGESGFNTETLKLANVVIVMLPITLLYPFLQKYFIKGLMVGAVKG